MSDEFTVMDDDDQTLIVDDEDDGGGSGDVDVFEEEGDQGFEDDFVDEDVEITAGAYKPDSNIYTSLIILTTIAYAGALAIVLMELYDYCKPNLFMWGMFADN